MEAADTRAEEGDQGESRAFLVLRHLGELSVVDLALGASLRIGSAPDADLRLDAASIAPQQVEVAWDGKGVSIRPLGSTGAATFVNGKRLIERMELKPGDELAMGPAQLVLGVATPLEAGGRRSLTHHELRERLAEEVARASRRGRKTSVVMLKARSGTGGQIASAALETFRMGDVIATWASDQLEVLLPDTSGEEARAVLSRVARVAGVDFEAGLAVGPEDGDDADRLVYASRRALKHAMREGLSVARPPEEDPLDTLPVFADAATLKLAAAVTTVAKGQRSALFTGEISTGKTVLAHRLHRESGRADGPFIVLSCTELMDDAGAMAAFGGADGGCRAELARGGTLVLEEVGDLPPGAQHLLFALLTREGSAIRVLSTTQRTLAGLVERGAFEAPLYDLLTDEVLEVPALRNRPDDLLPLAEHFAARAGSPGPLRLSAAALARLRSYPWPGNVLELRNAIERALRLAGEGEILAEHLPSDPLPLGSGEGRLREHVDGVERDAIIKALADSNHNQTHAAKRLGISRRALIYKMEKYGLKRPPGQGRR
ncbi:MAG: FHA domain-containing protein [Deltaproteobacteria bacterium]|nr:FHA domain-containing protein [Deltaproteobacteria bacterium]